MLLFITMGCFLLTADDLRARLGSEESGDSVPDTADSGDTAESGDTADSSDTADTAVLCPDIDLDGHADAACGGDDCDDVNGVVHPGAPDGCDDVDNDCDGDVDDGLRVPTDYPWIQGAIDASVQGETVCVAAGWFMESVDVSGHEITLEGAGSGSTIVDAAGTARALTVNDPAISPTVRGFTFTRGSGNYGGGGYVGGLSPVLDDLVFDGNTCTAVADCLGTGLYVLGDVTMTDITVSNNEAIPAAATADTIYGAGVYFNSASGTVTRLVVSGNTADVSSAYSYGYAIGAGVSSYNSSVAFDDVELSENVALGSGAVGVATSIQGVALALSVDASTFDGLTITGNSASSTGTADTIHGGAVAIGGGSPTFGHLLLADNAAGAGGEVSGAAMYLSSTTATFTNAIIASNSGVSTYGNALGALAVVDGATPTFTNVDVVNNGLSGVVSSGGGVYAAGASALTLRNTTLYGNSVSGTIHAGGAWYAIDTATSIAASYCDFFGNTDAEFVGMASPVGADGNIAVFPDYTNIEAKRGIDYDLTLRPGSALIDAGDASLLDADGSRSDVGAYGGSGGVW